MTRVHILCDSPKTLSGFSNVGKHLAEGLTNLGYEVSMTGFHTAYESEWYNKIEVMPINVQYIDDVTQYMMNVQKSKADAVICIFNSDDEQQNMYAKAIKNTLWYTPIEGRNISDLMIRDLLQVGENGRIVAQCNWGYNEMKKVGIESKVIYHGYNPGIFKCKSKGNFSGMITNQKINLLKYSEGRWISDNVSVSTLKDNFKSKFIFGFVGANHGIRKRIERLLTAYSIFLNASKKNKDRTLLVLRTMPISISGINLIKICANLGISSNVVFLYGDNNRLSDESMNIIYNLFDVNVSASSSEGFGFPTLESMACGIPQIGPACSSFIELIKDRFTSIRDRGLIADKGEWQMIPDGSYRFLVNEQCLADKMQEMYIKEEKRNEFSENCIKFASQYTWDKIAKEWNELIRSSIL